MGRDIRRLFRHRQMYLSLRAIPIQYYSCVSLAWPICCHLVILFQRVPQMMSVFLAHVFHSKIIYYYLVWIALISTCVFTIPTLNCSEDIVSCWGASLIICLLTSLLAEDLTLLCLSQCALCRFSLLCLSSCIPWLFPRICLWGWHVVCMYSGRFNDGIK